VTPRYVSSADGTRIACYESGDPQGPVLVAIHGYPDNHTVWDGVAAELGDRFRVVTYDVRGAGESDQPAARSSYRIERLSEAFAAVIDEVSPDAPVHLLGHDWGSIQAWGPVTDPRFAGRIASYTSISGPCLDYVGIWMRDRSHPLASLRQLLGSWYIAMFQIPRLPERLVRLSLVDRGLAKQEGGDRISRGVADKVNGIQLYRANMPQRLARPRPRPTQIPVQVLAPTFDDFVSVPLATQTPVPYVENLTVQEIAGGHWVVVQSAARVAAYVAAFAEEHSPQAAGRRARS
jgi:pimeloyl-ACP methyl ester carboxylesterase